ncbi:MAG: enolase [Planctomycetota bacterium]|jgi:enolase|nr:enolase [Planctomycetota bacterium]
MPKIKRLTARQLIDCKCRPMVEVDIETDDGHWGRGSSPTGSSVGHFEAAVIRDGDPREYDGQGVHQAVANVTKLIAPALIGRDVMDQRGADQVMLELDGTPDKSKLGGNAIYSVSIACLRAAAACRNIPVYQHILGREPRTVPVPSFNIVNGGHYGDTVLAFNEFLVVPYGAASIAEAVEIGVKSLAGLGKILRRHLGHEPMVGKSYGWAAPSDDPDRVLGLMQELLVDNGWEGRVAFALDCASSEMFDRDSATYLLKGRRIKAEELIAYARELSEKYPLVFIEDLLDEDDWENYPKAVKAIPRSLIIGDDLTVTNLSRIRRAYESQAVEGFILKPNQVGSITEALDAHAYAKENGMVAIPSGRAGGVVDDVVMDFSVGLEVPLQKNGAPRSGERITKLNFLMRAADLSPGCRMFDLSQMLRFK